MPKLTINSYSDFENYNGHELGSSDWIEVDQDRIDKFADATLDYQWIHTDPDRAKTESPFGQTIVHGYLTLSLLPYLWGQIIEVNNLKMMVNYGMDKMKFGQAVLSSQRIRLHAFLEDIQDLRGTCKAQVSFKMEIENQRKPALSGIATFLYYFQ